MASAPAPRASTSANGSFCAPSRTRPLEPTQIAPDFSTTGNSAAASPPVMGSLALPRAARVDTTTRFTGPILMFLRVLTAIHQYGSLSPFQRNETKFRHRSYGTHDLATRNFSKLRLAGVNASISSRSQPRFYAITDLPQLRPRRDAQATPARRAVRRNVRRHLVRAGPRKMRDRRNQA